MDIKNVIKKKWFFIPVICMAVVVICIGGLELNYADKYYPGVNINGQSVAGKTYNEVLEEFTVTSDNLTKHGLDLVFIGEKGKKEINIPATATGLTPDALVNYFSVGDFKTESLRAYIWGRKGNIIQRLREQSTLVGGKNFNVSVFAYRTTIQSLLSEQLKKFFAPTVPAQFSFDKNGNVLIIPEKLGENIRIETITDTIAQNLYAFNTQPLAFNLERETPYTTEEKLTPLLPLVEKISASANIYFHYQNHVWKVDGKKLVTWITLKPDNKITVDDKKIKAFLFASVDTLIDGPPQNSRFKMDGGNLIEVSPGLAGEAANIEKTVTCIETIITAIQKSMTTMEEIPAELIVDGSKITFNAKNNGFDVPIEITTAQPDITQKTINQYNITDLIGTATTNFKGGSLDRQRNIEVGVSKLTGILIAPGQEFSTTKSIGEITEEAGFVKEFVIKEDQTIKELGGGLCQLSTTLFRTALNSGLPITERTNHKFVIPYYGPGLDATIYDPHPDFRFVNDTGNYLLLQGTAKNNEVTFELYGTTDERVAYVSNPILSNEKPVPETRNIMTSDLLLGQVQCTTSTYKGVTADVTYTVNYKDGTVKTQDFHSVYQPWPKVCLIGTSSSLPPPIPAP